MGYGCAALIVAASPPPPMPHVLRSPAHRLLIARLRQARLAAGLRQAEVAARLGVPQSHVAKVEGGERRLEVVDFVRLAQAVGADPAVLVGEVAALLDESRDRAENDESTEPAGNGTGQA